MFGTPYANEPKRIILSIPKGTSFFLFLIVFFPCQTSCEDINKIPTLNIQNFAD